MEKKNLLSRPRVVQQIRPKANLPSGSFIALGARPSTPETGHSSASGQVKREGGPIPLTALGPSKKLRVGVESRPAVSPSSVIATGRRETSVENIWQGAASDVSPATFASRFEAAEERGKVEKLEKLILGLVKLLFDHRTKAPDPAVAAQFCYLAREKAQYFRESIFEALCASLRKPVAAKAVHKCHPLVYQLLGATLFRALQNREEWPDVLVKAYLDDALTDRAWVDRKDCHQLVQNILTAFGTEEPSPEFLAYLYYGEGSRASIDRGGGSPLHPGASPLYDEDSRSREAETANVASSLEEDNSGDAAACTSAGSTPSSSPARFAKSIEAIRVYTIEVLRDWWSRRLDTVPKGLVMTMAATCGYPEVRLAAAQKLDAWLQNAKLQRAATELMMYVCVNFKESTDMETLSYLTRLRFKSRVVANSYCFILKELFARIPSSLPIVLKLVVHNELSPTARAPHNMLIIGQCFQYNSDLASQVLANICFELLSTSKEDYSRSLRGFLREVARSALKYDFPMNAFCRALTQERTVMADLAVKDRVFHTTEDLLCLCAFIAVSPPLRDAALAVARGDRREINLVNTYQRNVRQMQNDAVAWVHTVVPGAFRPSKEDYARCLYRVIFMEKPEFYSSKDNWPTDQERNLYLKIIAESGVDEDTILRILTIGLSSDNSLSPTAALELIEQLVKRTALAILDPKFCIADISGLRFNDLHVVDLLFNCCRYRPPDSYQLPPNYSLPMLAIIKSFWIAANVLLILAAHSPAVIGKFVWENYPTLQYMIEMVISDDYSFPPVTTLTEACTADYIKQQDLQMAELEKQEILQLEGYLATGVVITESNSSLLAHLMRLEPKGVPRRPPTPVLEALKSLNQQLNLGLAFCRSREPDFLLEVINRQGSSHSLPWLIQLIHKNEGSLKFLPVQCLCEFLLHHLENEQRAVNEPTSGAHSEVHQLQNSKELRQRLNEVVWDENGDSINTENTLLYFFNRLQADTEHDRKMAIRALEILLTRNDNTQPEAAGSANDSNGRDLNWLLDGLPSIPHFTAVRSKIVSILSKCVLIETSVNSLRDYIAFMAAHASDSELDDIVLNMGKMVYSRRAVTDRLLSTGGILPSQTATPLRHLLDLCGRHLKHIQSAASGVISWSASQDQLLIQWGETASAIMNVNVVAATLLLLGYPRPEGSSSYDHLMENWFPTDLKPCAYMLDTSEEAELIPEDVKFHLLLSGNANIVDSVLKTMDDRQLLTCVEYSGLRPDTISKVCALLDTTVVNNVALLEEMRARAETWLGFLLSHQMRGASIGTMFVDWCRQNTSESQVETVEKMDTSSLDVTATASAPILDSKDSKSVSQMIEAAMYNDQHQGEPEHQVVHQWSQLLAAISSSPENVLESIRWFYGEINKNNVKLLDGLNRRKKLAICVFRILAQQSQVQPESAKEYALLRDRLFAEGDRLDNSISSVLQKDMLSSGEEKMDVEAEAPTADTDDSERAKAILQILDKLQDRADECDEESVDSVLRLDPEIVCLTPWQQLRCLFGSSKSVCLRHVLSLLPHWGHVDTLRRVVDKLLTAPDDAYDSSKVLDFIAAVIELPRLWAGREPKLPRHYQRENILRLSDVQLENLLHYIISELSALPHTVPACDRSFSAPSPSTKSKMEWTPHGPFSNGAGVPSTCMEGKLQERLKLLLECCQSKFKPVVRWLISASGAAYDKNVVRLFLLELYFLRPDISQFISDTNSVWDIRCLIHSGYTSLDAVIYRLITAYAQCAEDVTAEQELVHLDARLWELASAHPTIVIRHIPVIAAYLRGTMSMSLRKYDKTNYLRWYDMVLNLLDKLRSIIFDIHYSDSLIDIMNCFFDFIQNHGLRGNKFVPMLDKILQFVCHLHDRQQDKASQFLHSHALLIHAVTARFPDLASVREIKKICC